MVSRARLFSLGLIETSSIANAAVTAEKLSNISTSSIYEGANLYFTNARVVSALVQGQNITIESNGRISAAAQEFSGNTNLVAEGSNNLYFTNARVYANIIGLLNGKANVSDLTTSNVLEGSNLYFTNTRAVQAFISGTGIIIESNGRISSTASFSGNTDVIPEGVSNLYYTNTRARSAFLAGDGITIESNGRISSFATFSGTTDNVPEGISNQYFTNARAVAAISSGPGVNVAANGMLSLNTYAISMVSELFTSNGSNITHVISKSVKGNSSIILLVNGLSQIPGTDYSVSNNIITLSSAAPSGASIDIRYFSLD